MYDEKLERLQNMLEVVSSDEENIEELGESDNEDMSSGHQPESKEECSFSEDKVSDKTSILLSDKINNKMAKRTLSSMQTLKKLKLDAKTAENIKFLIHLHINYNENSKFSVFLSTIMFDIIIKNYKEKSLMLYWKN